MSYVDNVDLEEIIVQDKPSNPVLKEFEDDPIVKKMFSREEINARELIPDKFEYVRKVGAASWKEAHLVYEIMGETKIPRIIKIINETEFAKLYRNANNKDKLELIKKEMLGGNPNSLEGLAFAYTETLKNGQIAMVEEFLPESIENIDFKYRSFDENLEDLIGFAKGLNSLHSTLNKVWGDGKPEHFRYTDSKFAGKKIPKLNDFGTASKGSWSFDGKTATGDFLYRAPETFREYFHPEKVNDVYSFGAVAYYMFTGEDLNKELFDNVTKNETNILRKVQMYEKFMSKADDNELSKYYKRKLKKVPKKIRTTLFDMIRPDKYPYEEKGINKIRGKRSFRYQNGKEVLEALEDIKQNQIGTKYLKKTARKAAAPLVFATLLSGALLGGFYLDRTYEPKELTYPQAVPIMELIDLGNKAENKELVKFDREPFIPEETVEIGMVMDVANRTDRYRLGAKNNFHLLNLSIGYVKAANCIGGRAHISDGYWENYSNYRAANPHQVSSLDNPQDPRQGVPAILPYAMQAAKNGKDFVDLEDMMVYTYGGKTLFEKVKGEIDTRMREGDLEAYKYQNYKNFEDKNGERLIPKDVVKFVDLWNSYVGMPESFLTEETKTKVKELKDNYTVKVVPTREYKALEK